MFQLTHFTKVFVSFACFTSSYYCATNSLFTKTKFVSIQGGSTSSTSLSSANSYNNEQSGKLKLIYFDIKGVAELSRIILKVSQVDFIDERCFAIMENGKMITPEFDRLKLTDVMNPNMNRLPVLITNSGVVLGQSKTIERYLATKFNMMGNNLEEYCQIDCIVENIRDIKEKFNAIRRIGGMGKPSEEKDIAIKKWFEEGELQSWLEKLEKSLPLQPKTMSAKDILPYAVGGSMSYADLSLWHFISDSFEDKYKEFIKISCKNCPRITKIVETVAKNNQVENWLNSRPVTPF